MHCAEWKEEYKITCEDHGANAGLSVKERLALLQNNNNSNSNNNHNANKPANAAVKPVTPKPSPTEAKPPGIAGFKPVTPSKPVAPSVHKPGAHPDKPVLPPDKPATAAKPLSPNKPLPASKPAFANKPSPAMKPSTAATGKAGVEEAGWPKLRRVGGEKGTPPASQQSAPPARETGGDGETPVVLNSSHGTGESSVMSAEIWEQKPTSVVTPLKHVSVQERLAALRRKSSEAESVEMKPKPSSTLRSSSTLKTSSVFPPSPVSSGALNGQLSDSSEPKPETPGVRRSDIAKSLTHAADRFLLRSKTTTDTAAATSTADSSEEKTQRSSHLFQRRSDGKKFRKLDDTVLVSSQPAPAKPSRMDNVDLKPFLQAYASAKEDKLEVDAGQSRSGAEGAEGEMEEMCVEAESSSVTIRGRKGSVKKATASRVSLIPEFTEEEEQQELYTDGTSGSTPLDPLEPEVTYDDCESALETPKQSEPPLEEPDEIYEPLEGEIPEEHHPVVPETIPPPLPSPNTPEINRDREKDKENKEKEEAARKKAKDEANKKEEKERRKKEEELKKMRRKFGLNEGDEKVGDGVAKSSASGGVFSKDLGVTRGETIAILRMDGNPAGKWLVQNEHGKIGFVNSNNIEISTPTIRHLMEGVKHETGASEEPEEMYEVLPEGEMDEIYEEL
ncbi:hypothetical protein ACOMHN_002366 [Nucella lapillus]